jgi:hypothetical protein
VSSSAATEQWRDDVPKPFALPPIVSFAEFTAVYLEMPAVLVEGLIRKQSVVLFASASKAYKTWTAIHLGLSVSQGVPWLGRDVTQGRVLFLNFELTAAELQARVNAIAGSMPEGEPQFDICNLRGQTRDIKEIVGAVIEHCQGKDYAMIIPDPIYSMMGNRNEIAANEMAEFLSHLSRLSEATGAAVVYTHHFAKGNAAKKEQIDRASGSGVFSRHADGIITFTRHKEDNAFTVEAELRSFPRPAPFVVKWEFPRMAVVDLDPTQLKNKAGRTRLHNVGQLLDSLTDGMTAGEWIAAAEHLYGIGKSTFYSLRKEACADGRACEKDRKWFRIRKPIAVKFDGLGGVESEGATSEAA